MKYYPNKNGNVLVTVIVITYNQQNYIRECLDSILSQKTDFEYKVYIHDDCSTDDTFSILKEYYEKDDRISVGEEEENQYQQGKITFQSNEPFCEGEFVCFCEGDDYWIDDHKIQNQVDFLNRNQEYPAVASITKKINEDNGEEYFNDAKANSVLTLEDIYYADYTNSLCLNAIMMRKKYIKLPKVFDPLMPRGGDDGLYTYLTFSGGIFLMDKCMTVHRLAAQNSYNWTNRNRSKCERLKHNLALYNATVIKFSQWNEYSRCYKCIN